MSIFQTAFVNVTVPTGVYVGKGLTMKGKPPSSAPDDEAVDLGFQIEAVRPWLDAAD